MSGGEDTKKAVEPKKKGDLSITALYTSQTWTWGGLPEAALLATPEAKIVFRVTNVALFFAKLVNWKLPSLRCSLLQRHAMIDELVRRQAPTQVIELAAGLSRRGASFSRDPKLSYVEVDLPHVIEKKRELLGRSDEGKEVLARANLKLVAGDVSEVDLDAFVVKGARLVVIAEGLLMYLQPAVQRLLWSRIRRMFDVASDGASPEGLFVFDLVPACEQPAPGLMGRALEAMMKRFTGGRSFERDARTRQDIAREAKVAGFAEVEPTEPRDVARAWSLPFPNTRTQQLLFVCRPSATSAPG